MNYILYFVFFIQLSLAKGYCILSMKLYSIASKFIYTRIIIKSELS